MSHAERMKDQLTYQVMLHGTSNLLVLQDRADAQVHSVAIKALYDLLVSAENDDALESMFPQIREQLTALQQQVGDTGYVADRLRDFSVVLDRSIEYAALYKQRGITRQPRILAPGLRGAAI